MLSLHDGAQAPYADKGYVDPDYKGPLDALKGLFGGSKKEKGENK